MEQPAKPDARKRAPTPGSWKPGVSGNAKGRPRKGNALTESIRTGCDPDELLAIALDLARNGESESTRMQALCWLRDSGFTRPAERHELGPPGAHEEADDDALARQLTDAELDELDRLDEQRARILASAGARGVFNPLVVDGDVALLPAGVARTDED